MSSRHFFDGPGTLHPRRRWQSILSSRLAAFGIGLGLFGGIPLPAADLYWRVDGTKADLTSASWSSTGSGPYSTAWVNGSNLLFTANSTITYVTSTVIGNISLNDGITVTWAKAGTLTTGGTVRSVTIGAGSTLLWNGQNVSTAGGTGFIKNGAGTWDLGAITNGYAGGFTLNAGTVIAGGLNSLGAGALNLNGGTLVSNNSSTKDFTGKFTGISLGGDVQFGDAIAVPAGTGGLTFSAAAALGSATRTLTLGASAEFTLSGKISGGSGAGLTVATTSSGGGVLVLSGANAYTGPTTITGGALRLNSAGAWPSASNLRLAGGVLELGSSAPAAFALGTNGGELQWTGDGGFAAAGADRSVTLNAGAPVMWGSGNFVADGKRLLLGSATSTKTITLTNDIDLGSSVRTITVPPSPGPFGSASAVLSGRLSGSGALVIEGGGWLSLSGSNDYSGGTTLLGGTLSVGSDQALGSGPLNFGNGISTSAGTLSPVGSVTLTNDIVLTLGPTALYQFGGVASSTLTLAGVISGAGRGFTHSGGGVLELAGDNTFNGVADLPNGTVIVGHDHAFGTGPVQLSGATIKGDGTPHTIANPGTFSSFVIDGASDLTFSGKLTNKSAGFTTTVEINNTGITTFGAIDLSADSGLRTVSFVVNAGANMVVAGSVSNGPLSTYTSVAKSGSGPLTFAGTNTYSGTTVVTGGILAVAVLSNGSSPSGIGQSTFTATNLVLSNATLKYIGTGASTNRLFQLGQATPGATATIDASGSGSVMFTNTGAIIYGNGDQARGLVLSGTNAGENVFAPALSNNGSAAVSLTKTGPGKWVVSGANSYRGETAINGGTLSLGSATALGPSGLISFGGGTLQFTAANTIDYSTRFSTAANQAIAIDTNGQNVTFAAPLVSAGGTLTKLGAGTLLLASTNSYDGGTSIAGGTLELTGAGTLGSGQVLLTGGRLRVPAGREIVNEVVFQSSASRYELLRGSGDDYDALAGISALGGIETTARLLAGTALGERMLSAAFVREASALNDGLRISDVFALEGTDADVFVLELGVAGIPEGASDIWLGSLDESANEWVNGVAENTGNTAAPLQQGFVGSFANFQLLHGTALDAYIGAYGIDPDAHTVWAVLNHSDSFAIVPEPGAAACVAVVLAILGLTHSRRKPGGR